MSKIKGEYDFHTKEKLRHSLRRKEEKNIKESRLNAANNDEYRYCRGYYVRDERYHGRYEIRTVPERTEERWHLSHWETKRHLISDTNGDVREVYWPEPIHIIEKVIIPEHEEIVKRCGEYVPIKPYLCRMHITKRFYKRMAAKAARKTAFSNGANYKKAYDIAWSLW